MTDSQKLRKGAELFREMAFLYDELASLNDIENPTKEQEEKLYTLTGKIFMKVSEIQEFGKLYE